MAIGKLDFGFNSRGVVDPYSNLMGALGPRGAMATALTSQDTKAERDRVDTLNREKMAAEAKQRAFANELATSREARAAQAEKDRLADRAAKEEANRLLSTAFSNVPTTRSVESEVVVEGPSAGNQAQREAILAENERLEVIRKGLDPALNQQAEEAGAKYAELFEQYSKASDAPTGGAPSTSRAEALRNRVNNTGFTGSLTPDATGSRMLQVLNVPNAVDTAADFLGDRVNNLLGTKIGIRPSGDTRGSIHNPVAPPIGGPTQGSAAELQQSIATTPADRALQDSGLLALNKRIDELSTKELAEVPELRGATPAQIKKIQKTVKLKPEEQISELRNSIMNLDIPYEYKKDALTSMDSMFPRPKQADPIALAKLQFEVAKEEATAEKERSTVEAWNKQNGTNFETMDQLKLSLTASKGKGPVSDPFSDILTVLDKDTEDADAWINFLSQNKEILDGMGKADKERITNFVIARYAHESSLDPTDIFGGSSALGDVLDEISEVFPKLKYKP